MPVMGSFVMGGFRIGTTIRRNSAPSWRTLRTHQECGTTFWPGPNESGKGPPPACATRPQELIAAFPIRDNVPTVPTDETGSDYSQAAFGTWSGKKTEKQVPHVFSFLRLRTRIEPPSRSTILCAAHRPSPVPCSPLVVKNGSKI